MVEIRALQGLAASSRRAGVDPFVLVAEADGNRTRQAGDARLNGFEDRGAHQDPDASIRHATSTNAVLPTDWRSRPDHNLTTSTRGSVSGASAAKPA